MASTEQNKVIRVSSAVDAVIRKHASKRGVTVSEAADALVLTGHSRLAALSRYAKNGTKPKKKKKRARA